jgi:Leucine-rich repeat (LRR) protein
MSFLSLPDDIIKYILAFQTIQDLIQCTYVSKPIKELCHTTEIYDKKPLIKHKPLWGIFIRIRTNDIENILNKKVLKELYCYNTEISSVEGLINLQILDCSCTGITSVEGLINLRELYCSNSGVTSLEGLTDLQILYCANTGIKSVKELVNLIELLCFDTKINSVEGLVNLQILHCCNTGITSVKGLKNLKELYHDRVTFTYHDKPIDGIKIEIF